MRDRGQHVVEQRETLAHAEALLLAMEVDGFALHQLEHEIGLPAGRHAGVEQARDVRVRQARQDLAFALEALGRGAPEQRQVQQFHRDFAAVAPVVAPRPPHGAAPALPERRVQRVGAQALADQGGRLGGERLPAEEAFDARRASGRQQACQRLGRLRVVATQGFQPRRALARRQVQQLVELRTQAGPVLRVDGWLHARRVIQPG